MSGADGGGGKERSRLLSVRYRWSQRRIRMALPERGRFGLVPALPWAEMKEAEPFGQTLLPSSTSTNASTIILKLPAHQLNSHTTDSPNFRNEANAECVYSVHLLGVKRAPTIAPTNALSRKGCSNLFLLLEG